MTGPVASVPLPSAAEIRVDVQRMVDCGPRLTGYDAHDRFCTWVEDEMRAAGLEVLPSDVYRYERYQPGDFGLEVLDGDAPGPIAVPTWFVRTVGTPPGGVTGPLLVADGFPQLDAFQAMANPFDVATAIEAWIASVPAGRFEGSILLVDLDTPARLSADIFLLVAAYLQWDEHTEDDWSRIDYSRAWLGPWPDLNHLTPLGVQGVVFTTRASWDAMVGNNSLHINWPQPIPALVVDRDTGAALHGHAARGAQVRLRLEVAVDEVRLRQQTALLRGRSDECIIVNTHTDGQNAFEENGACAAVAMARHFASLPEAERLDRTLVFAFYPGHMSGRTGIEDPRGWIGCHVDLVDRAVAAVSIEHLGATEWVDDPEHGFHATGEPELYGIWTTQGPMLDEIARPALVASGLQRHALLKPPLQITPGRAFHWLGVPHVSGIAGPTYLLQVSETGGMDKFDADLAADQIAFYADIVRRLDTADPAALRRDDATLGVDGGSDEDRTYRDDSVAEEGV